MGDRLKVKLGRLHPDGETGASVSKQIGGDSALKSAVALASSITWTARPACVSACNFDPLGG